MTKRTWKYFYALVPVCLVLLSLGCSGSEANRYYLLNADAPRDTQCQRTGAGLSIGIGPVKIPDYLNRNPIVSRTTGSGVILAQFDRWAEPLDSGISRVMAEDLSRLLCAKTVHIFPWKAGTPIDYRVIVDVLRLDGTVGGEVAFDAQWSVSPLGHERKTLIANSLRVSEKAGEAGYNSLVEAHSRMIGQLSKEIAAGIGDLQASKQSPGKTK